MRKNGERENDRWNIEKEGQGRNSGNQPKGTNWWGKNYHLMMTDIVY